MNAEYWVQLQRLRDEVEAERARLVRSMVGLMVMGGPATWDPDTMKDLGSLQMAIQALEAELARSIKD